MAGTPGRIVRWTGGLLFAVLLLVLARESTIRSVDFPVYHRVAREMLAGDFGIYPVEASGNGPMPSHGFRYAPVVAFLMMPLGWLPLGTAALVLYLLKLAAAGYVGAVVARRAGLPVSSRAPLIAAFLLVGGYVAEEFRYGNVHFLIIAAMVYAFDAVEEGRVVAPALALALAIATKVTPLALLGYFAVRRRTAVVVATIAALAGLALAPAMFLGMRENASLLRRFAAYALQKVDEQDNYSLLGVLVRHLTTEYPADVSHLAASIADLPPAVVTALWLFGLAVMGLLALAVILPERADPAVGLLELSIVLTGIVLAAPHTQRRYFIGLYVPVAALLALRPRLDEGTKRVALVGVAATAAAGTVLPLVFGGRRLALMYEAASPYFFGTLVLFGALLLVTARLKQARAAQPFAADRA